MQALLKYHPSIIIIQATHARNKRAHPYESSQCQHGEWLLPDNSVKTTAPGFSVCPFELWRILPSIPGPTRFNLNSYKPALFVACFSKYLRIYRACCNTDLIDRQRWQPFCLKGLQPNRHFHYQDDGHAWPPGPLLMKEREREGSSVFANCVLARVTTCLKSCFSLYNL